MNSSLEIVYQEAMENDCKTGEKLKISDGDPFQLMRITCSTFQLSNHLLHNYDATMDKNIMLDLQAILFLKKITIIEEKTDSMMMKQIMSELTY